MSLGLCSFASLASMSIPLVSAAGNDVSNKDPVIETKESGTESVAAEEIPVIETKESGTGSESQEDSDFFSFEPLEEQRDNKLDEKVLQLENLIKILTQKLEKENNEAAKKIQDLEDANRAAEQRYNKAKTQFGKLKSEYETARDRIKKQETYVK